MLYVINYKEDKEWYHVVIECLSDANAIAYADEYYDDYEIFTLTEN